MATGIHPVKLLVSVSAVLRTHSRFVARFTKITYPWMNRRKPYWVHEKAVEGQDADLTRENAEFAKAVRTEAMRELWESPGGEESPLREAPWPRNTEFTRKTQRCGLIGIKLGVYPMWDDDARKVDCTVIQIPDNHVIRWYPPEETYKLVSLREMRPYMPHRHWYPGWVTQHRWGVQLVGAVSADPAEFSAAWCGLFREAGVPVKRKIMRFHVSRDAALQPGTPIHMEHFRVGDYVDISARTVNRGFQGVMERWKMEGGPAGHGSTKFHRKMGAAAGGGKKILRGKHMPGVMGNRFRAIRSLQIVRMNPRHRLIYVRGQTPGPVHSYCQIFDSWMVHRRRLLWDNPPPMPTFYPEDAPPEDEDVPEDIYHDSIRPYDAPSIVYEPEPEPRGRR